MYGHQVGAPSPSLYGRVVRGLRSRGRITCAVLLGASMHAAGHALLAAAGGGLARALAGGSSPIHPRSMAILDGVDPVVALGIVGLLAAGLKLVGGVVAAYGEARIAGEIAEGVRLEMLERVHAHQPLRTTRQADHGAGRSLAALTTHVTEVERGVTSGVFALVRAVLALAPLVVLLAWLAPSLVSGAAFAIVAFGVVAALTRRALARAHKRAALEAEAVVAAADEAVRHADLWVTYGAQRTLRAHVVRLGRTVVATAARLRAWGAGLSGASEVLGAFALVLVVLLVANGMLGFDRAAIVPFAVAFFMAYKPLRELVDSRIAIARAEASLARMEELPVRTHAADVAPMTFGPATLVLEGVVASHGDHAPIDLVLAPGRVAAIVGPTGAGKTSLLRVLLGLDRARAGTVRYGDVVLDGRPPGPGGRPFAWVPQDAPVLAATLDENVQLGREDADVGAILASMGAADLAARCGDDVLGASARAVSGGERQRIAVARALATTLPVLLLDEPTSGLDDASERAMLAALSRLRTERSIVIVTHRPAPLAIADVVVRLRPASPRSEHAEDRARRDTDDVAPLELAIEHVRALTVGEAQHQLRREGVDAGAE